MKVYVDKNKFKIFNKKPKLGIKIGETKHTIRYSFTTNNSKFLQGIKAKRGNKLIYEK